MLRRVPNNVDSHSLLFLVSSYFYVARLRECIGLRSRVYSQKLVAEVRAYQVKKAFEHTTGAKSPTVCSTRYMAFAGDCLRAMLSRSNTST